MESNKADHQLMKIPHTSRESEIRAPSRSRLRGGVRDAGGPPGLPWRGQEGLALLASYETETEKNEHFHRACRKTLDPRARK